MMFVKMKLTLRCFLARCVEHDQVRQRWSADTWCN